MNQNNDIIPVDTNDEKYYIPTRKIIEYLEDPVAYRWMKKKVSKTDRCEAYILKEYINEWETAKMSYGDRPDWDVEIEDNNSKRSFEVKTQGINYDSIYIEIGEYGDQKPKSVANDNWYQWVKTGLFASEADTYVIFKETNVNDVYNYYEIDASFLKNTIDSYLFTDLFGKIVDKGKEFSFKSNYAQNTSLKDTIEYLQSETFRKNKGVQRFISSSTLGHKNQNGVFQPFINGFASTTEKNVRWNVNILFNLQPLIDAGIVKKTVLNVDISLASLEPIITKYFVGAEIDHYGSPVIENLKKEHELFNITKEEIITELKTWNYDVLFDKSYFNNNGVEKYPDMTLTKILTFQFDLLPFFYITSTENSEKTLGIEKVGLGYDSDSSSDSESSSDSDTGLQFMNLIKR
jgi:hypothetical protein